MCTVSLIRPCGDGDGWGPTGLRLRLVFNRDERRDRPAGLPPYVRPIGAMQVGMPLDPEGAGTWVAANSAGLVFAVLNGPGSGLPGGAVSRGLIVPRLAGCSTLDDAQRTLADLDARAYRPWRALVADGHEWIDASPGPGGVATKRRPLGPATMLTSSTLEPARAARLRTRLFGRLVARRPSPVVQDTFHAHRWPHLPELSVAMERDGSCTVSHTVVEVYDAFVRLKYRAEPGVARTVSLPRFLPAREPFVRRTDAVVAGLRRRIALEGACRFTGPVAPPLHLRQTA